MNLCRLGKIWSLMAACAMALHIGAQENAAAVQWSGKDIAGKDVSIPAAGKTSLLLFIMAEQAQSRDAIKQMAASLGGAGDLQVLVVISGEQAAAGSVGLQKSGQCPWPIVADTDYAASGKASVRVWPTTVLVSPSGEVIGHLAGVPKTYARDLDSYLAFAAGKINKDELAKRLSTDTVIADSPEQIASRHLQVAQRLLEKGLSEQARAELNAGLKLHPQSPALKLMLTRVLIVLGEPTGALKTLDELEGLPVSPSQIALLRGKAMVSMGKWDAAAELLQRAVRLNPEPAAAWYELGLVYQHTGDWSKAADAFRRAFESTDMGRKVIPATQPVQVNDRAGK